tara:strand:+ start:521 stop:916 length:396 start_codon:yes stop_codon:yes gene_type:complete
VQAERGASSAAFNSEMNMIALKGQRHASHESLLLSTVQYTSDEPLQSNIHALPAEPTSMSDELVVREGERIPRRPLPEFEEASSFVEAIKRDGFFGTAVADKNQYGPLAMMLLLLIVAGITGILIKLVASA